jgi:hypothetical protein
MGKGIGGVEQAIVQRRGEWLSAEVGDELVMMNADSGNYVTMSRVGARIWEMIEKPKSTDELFALLLREFDVTPETCRNDVQKFLDELVSHGAITLDTESAS